jgi:hypothetical protein
VHLKCVRGVYLYTLPDNIVSVPDAGQDLPNIRRLDPCSPISYQTQVSHCQTDRTRAFTSLHVTAWLGPTVWLIVLQALLLPNMPLLWFCVQSRRRTINSEVSKQMSVTRVHRKLASYIATATQVHSGNKTRRSTDAHENMRERNSLQPRKESTANIVVGVSCAPKIDVVAVSSFLLTLFVVWKMAMDTLRDACDKVNECEVRAFPVMERGEECR